MANGDRRGVWFVFRRPENAFKNADSADCDVAAIASEVGEGQDEKYPSAFDMVAMRPDRRVKDRRDPRHSTA